MRVPVHLFLPQSGFIHAELWTRLRLSVQREMGDAVMPDVGGVAIALDGSTCTPSPAAKEIR